MFGPELISLIGGGLAGFIFKYAAEARKERAENFKMALQAQKANDESQDKAAKRVPLDAGKIVRRFIVASVFFALVFGPFILSFFNIPMVIETKEHFGGWFFGLIPSWTDTVYTEVKGFLLIPEVRNLLPAIGGFYLGQGSAK